MMKEIWNVALAGLHSVVEGAVASDPRETAYVKTVEHGTEMGCYVPVQQRSETCLVRNGNAIWDACLRWFFA